MISVVIPARNEAAVIARTLAAMTAGADTGELDIVVVCNGCSDATAAIARGFGAPVRVVETGMPGKPRALNLGDAEARGFPRIYADADIAIAPDALRALSGRLARGDILAAAPSPRVDLSGSSFAVRAFYAIRARMPSSREGIGGSGVYALSQQGRARFGEFPDVIADDSFVRIHFKPHERVTLDQVHSTVFPPRRLRDLIAVRARAHAGNIELARLYPDMWTNRGERNERTLASLFKYPWLWPQLLIYALVTVVAKRRARARVGAASAAGARDWARDDTSRQPGAGSAR